MLVIVPNDLYEAINLELDKAFKKELAAAEDREELYQQLLNAYNELGYIPTFTLKKPATESLGID